MILARVLRPTFFKTLLAHPPVLAKCAMCGGHRLFVQTNAGKLVGRRCIVCRGTLVHQATFTILQDLFGRDLERINAAYELSAHGALWKALKRRLGPRLMYSELFDDVEAGTMRRGVRCENVEALTFASNTFDVVTSTGMFEHVENDLRGYLEIYRVLKPGGHTVYSVPYNERRERTIARAKRRPDGSIEHFLPPAYHSDPIRGENAVFVWRDHGRDIVDTLAAAGLKGEIRWIELLSQRIPVIVGRKPLCPR